MLNLKMKFHFILLVVISLQILFTNYSYAMYKEQTLRVPFSFQDPKNIESKKGDREVPITINSSIETTSDGIWIVDLLNDRPVVTVDVNTGMISAEIGERLYLWYKPAEVEESGQTELVRDALKVAARKIAEHKNVLQFARIWISLIPDDTINGNKGIHKVVDSSI